MGRLSTQYAGVPITYRVPFAMSGYVDLPAVTTLVPFVEQFSSLNFFLHSIDKPFEIHRMIPRVSQVSAAGVLSGANSANQDTFFSFIQMSLKERSRNQAMTASLTPLLNLVTGSAKRTWEWADPMTLVRGEGFRASAIMKQLDLGTALRLFLTFEGFLLIMPPAFDQR